jgi:PKHD-type hydroxylase
MVSDQHIRKTLFDLDRTIQSLVNNQHIERAEIDQLHHVYHNLIRQFSAV